MATRFARAGRRLAVFAVIGLAICGLTAVRQCDHPAAGGALSAVGRLARRADRHHLARRRARHRGVAGARRGRAQRGGRAHDRDGGAGAALSAGAHRVFRRLGPADLRRRVGGLARRAAVRELRHRQGAHHARRQVARHAGERALHQGTGAAQARRALAAGHLGASHAALGRPVPLGGISGRGLSGRLPHARRDRPAALLLDRRRRPAPHRHRDARMGRAAGLPDHGTDRGVVSRACLLEGPPVTPSSAAARSAGTRP